MTDPQAAAALLSRLRTGYGHWVAENAALSFGDGPPGCPIPQIEKERPVRVLVHAGGRGPPH